MNIWSIVDVVVESSSCERSVHIASAKIFNN